MGDTTKQFLRSGFGEIDPGHNTMSGSEPSNVVPFPATPNQENSAPQPKGAIGSGGNATHFIEDVERDLAGEVAKPDDEKVRESISKMDGEVALAKHDIGKLADKVIGAAGVVKEMVTPQKVHRSRVHGRMPKKPARPNARKGTPADTGSRVDFTKLDKNVVFRKPQ